MQDEIPATQKRNHFADGELAHTPKPNGQVRAMSSDVQAKLDLLIEAAIARGRDRRSVTLLELDTAAIAYYKIGKQAIIEREHAYGLCGPGCVLCEREANKNEEEDP